MCSFYLMIPKSPKSNAVRILKDPFHCFETFLLCLSAILNFWSCGKCG
jgi:hypothetical protein